MLRHAWPLTLMVLLITPSVLLADSPKINQVILDPPSLTLDGPNAKRLILIHGKTDTGKLIDLTTQAKWRIQNPSLAIATNGLVRARKDGSTRLIVEVLNKKYEVPIRVQNASRPRRFNFENDIVPILSRHGCNSSGCHGKAEGQNGFKLSVFGFDPPADHRALTQEGRGRRIFMPAPKHSLLLRKISGGVAHGGGRILSTQSDDYETLRAWIALGVPLGESTDPKVMRIRVEPGDRQLAMRSAQQLRVTATWSDGRESDVTTLAKFQSNNESLARVNEGGLIEVGEVPGDVAIMASYMGSVDVFRALIPRPQTIKDFPKFPEKNFIDRLVITKLRQLNVKPSAPASDADFLRRVYLDVIGTLPTAKEVREFINDNRANRRSLLVERLLKRPELTSFWALQWADLLRVDRLALGHKDAYAYYRWIRESIAKNKPLDQFARELITAEGPLKGPSPNYFYSVVKKPGERASTLSMVFLGVRIACAECHHHPFDRWSQTDYFGMHSYFTPLRIQKSGESQILYATGNPLSRHPRTKAIVHAHPLGEKMPETTPEGKRRGKLAKWMTSAKNPWFAKNLANRVWAHFMGRGLVEPVDDVRLTNPPTNPALLEALAQHLIKNKFDLHSLIRVITSSQTYQLSTTPNATNEKDETNYSRAKLRRLSAEVLLDMLCQVTGVEEKFSGSPLGVRAIELWDSQVRNDFLTLFGRPVRVSTCECERSVDTNVRQVLHFFNSSRVQRKLSHEKGRLARWSRELKDESLVEEMYLTFYSRYPTKSERATALDYLKKNRNERRKAIEDLAWSMMSSIEFVLNH